MGVRVDSSRESHSNKHTKQRDLSHLNSESCSRLGSSLISVFSDLPSSLFETVWLNFMLNRKPRPTQFMGYSSTDLF